MLIFICVGEEYFEKRDFEKRDLATIKIRFTFKNGYGRGLVIF